MPPRRVTVAPKQSLGQNFLVDDNIARKIVRAIAPRPGDLLLEIGPGQGALTRHLAATGARVLAVEIDERVIDDLRTAPDLKTVEILHRDFLDTGLSRIAGGSRLRLVGNIPYHLTSPILFKAFDEWTCVADLTVMVQKEVAQRIVARPGTKDYGILSVVSRFYGTPELLFTVSPQCFYPKPKVTSAILHISFFDRARPGVNASLFREIVRATFGKRRKKIRNGLRYLDRPEQVLEAIGASDSRWLEKRPEELSVEDFIDLTGELEPIAGDSAPDGRARKNG